MNDFTLIANSGIQYFSTKMEIDLNSGFKILFHEWFDGEIHGLQQGIQAA